jgi:hypothetical protein
MGWLQSADTHTKLDNDDLGFFVNSPLPTRGGGAEGGGGCLQSVSNVGKTHALCFVIIPSILHTELRDRRGVPLLLEGKK